MWIIRGKHKSMYMLLHKFLVYVTVYYTLFFFHRGLQPLSIIPYLSLFLTPEILSHAPSNNKIFHIIFQCVHACVCLCFLCVCEHKWKWCFKEQLLNRRINPSYPLHHNILSHLMYPQSKSINPEKENMYRKTAAPFMF